MAQSKTYIKGHILIRSIATKEEYGDQAFRLKSKVSSGPLCSSSMLRWPLSSSTFLAMLECLIANADRHVHTRTDMFIHTHDRPAPVAQSVAFALPKTDCWEDLDRIPPGGNNKIEMKGLGDTALQLVGDG